MTTNPEPLRIQPTIRLAQGSVTKEIDDLREILWAIDGLLGWHFISLETRLQLETFRAELEAELNSLLSEQTCNAKAAS